MKLHIPGLLTALCLIGMSVFNVRPLYADETPSSVIDPKAPVTLTIHKYENNDAYQAVGNGCVQTIPGTPMEGIEYSVCRIGSWITAGDSQKTGAYYTELTDDFLRFTESNTRKEEALVSQKVGDVTVFQTDAVQTAVNRINAITGNKPGPVLLDDFVREHKTVSGKTGSDGTLKLTGLTQGIYLVAETDPSGLVQKEGAVASEAVMAASEPFLVTLPMTNQTWLNSRETGTQWQYNVHVYPKNATIAIPKYIVDEDGEKLLQADDRETGQDTVQILTPSVPAVRSSQLYEKYSVTDTMDEGLSYVRVDSVKIGNFIESPAGMSSFSGFAELDKDAYLVQGTPGENTFSITFTDKGLEKLNAVKEDSQLVITFTTRLNGRAPAGSGEMIANTPELTFKTRDTVESKLKGNTPKLCTYTLDLTKKGLTDASHAAFTIAQGKTEVSFTKEKDGVYHITDKTAGESGEKEVHPDPSGSLILKGFDSKEYIFTETATEPGKSLLTEPFSIIFERNEAINGSLKRALIRMNDKENTLTVSKGTAYGTIYNYPAAVLNTGGSGIAAFLAAGVAFLLGAFYCVHKRKSVK